MRIEVVGTRADIEGALIEHLGADWNTKLVVLADGARSESYGRKLGEVPPPEVITLITHAAAAVVGGMAYDATKELLRFLRRRFGAHNVSSDEGSE